MTGSGESGGSGEDAIGARWDETGAETGAGDDEIGAALDEVGAESGSGPAEIGARVGAKIGEGEEETGPLYGAGDDELRTVAGSASRGVTRGVAERRRVARIAASTSSAVG